MANSIRIVSSRTEAQICAVIIISCLEACNKLRVTRDAYAAAFEAMQRERGITSPVPLDTIVAINEGATDA